MTQICLVRHGETDWNTAGILQGQQNTNLNAVGRKQAHATGVYLSEMEVPFDLIVTSPLRRAKESATIINGQLQLPVLEMDAFAERAFGEAEGMSPEERDALYPEMEFPGQEPEKDFHHRVLRGFEQIAAQYKDQRIILVSHGLVIHLILSHLQGEEINYKQTTLLNACISDISFHEDIWHVNCMNQIDHLT